VAASRAAAEMEESRGRHCKITLGLARVSGPPAHLPSTRGVYHRPWAASAGARLAGAGAPEAPGAARGAWVRGLWRKGREGVAWTLGLRREGPCMEVGTTSFEGEEGLPLLSPGAVMAAMASLNRRRGGGKVRCPGLGLRRTHAGHPPRLASLSLSQPVH